MKVEEGEGLKAAVQRLVDAIGYPDRVDDSGGPALLRVDGAEVMADEFDGMIVLRYALAGDDANLPSLASYAAGRMLREDATLAYDVAGPSSDHPTNGLTDQRTNGLTDQRTNGLTDQRTNGLPDHNIFLWQSAPADADARTLSRLFETFMDSCDWWRARVEALREESVAPPEESIIRP